jgi:hypothetical protein
MAEKLVAVSSVHRLVRLESVMPVVTQGEFAFLSAPRCVREGRVDVVGLEVRVRGRMSAAVFPAASQPLAIL